MTDLVAFVDIDNTLLDHDRLKLLVEAEVERVAPGGGARFWAEYEAIRHQTGLADLPATARRFGDITGDFAAGEALGAWLWDFPFATLVYPGTADALATLARQCTLAIVCDGNDAFQRRKLQAAGLAGPFEGRMHVFRHKEEHVDELAAAHPAPAYLLFDDKPRIHRAFKERLGSRITTVLVRQGHYATAPATPGTIDHEVPTLAAALAALALPRPVG